MIGDVPFGWQAVIDCWKREVKKSTNDASANLNETSVYLDKWAKMNVKYSKAPFQYETILEMIMHVATEMGCLSGLIAYRNNEMKKNVLSNTTDDMTLMMMKDFLRILDSPKTALPIRSTLCVIKYSIAINGIFISRFLSNRTFTEDNIGAEEKCLRHHLEFFKKWDDDCKSKRPADKEWAKCFLATQTYRNIQVQIFGFLGY